MKELENVMSQLEKETKKKEQAENKIKQLRQKKSQLKRKADTKRKVEKGGVLMATTILRGAVGIDKSLIKKTSAASSCFMGLGQIIYLKQYVRGAFFALMELSVLFLINMQRVFTSKCLIVCVLSKYWATIIPNRIKMSTFVHWICCTLSQSQKLPMDHLTKEQRHKNMAANKGKGTKLEIMFGKFLWNAGIRYRKNDKLISSSHKYT